MSNDAKWILGTGIAVIASVVGSAVAVVAVTVTLVGGVREDVRDFRNDVRDFRNEVNSRMDGFATRLRNVEVAFGKIDQRLLTIERIILPGPEQPGQ